MRKLQYHRAQARRLVIVCAAIAMGAAVAAVSASAQTYTETVVYSFSGALDGSNPSALVRDGGGNLYGTTPNGGIDGDGNIFKITPAGHWSSVHTFTGQPNDGATPLVGLAVDKHGNGYGTTAAGGKLNFGSVYEIAATGGERLLYSFTAGPDGGKPCSPLAIDSAGNLYGTTSIGGTSGFGVVFKVTASGSESVLYSFPKFSNSQTQPCPGVALDAQGNIYGATTYNGSLGIGMIFKISNGVESTLYSFKGSTDGAFPLAGVILDSAANLYGTASEGGDLTACGGSGCGVLFKMSQAGHETILHTFEVNTDGDLPSGPLAHDSKGDLFGVTTLGGPGLGGTIFEYSAAGQFTILHAFSGPDGDNPYQNVILDAAGNIYGSTNQGGAIGYGTVFKLTP